MILHLSHSSAKSKDSLLKIRNQVRIASTPVKFATLIIGEIQIALRTIAGPIQYASSANWTCSASASASGD